MKVVRTQRLAYRDPPAGTIAMPAGPLAIHYSFGSGLAGSAAEPGVVWGVGDRGPNLKIATMVERYGATGLLGLADLAGAKVMPRLDLGPALAKFLRGDDGIELVGHFPLTGADGTPLSGLPVPEREAFECEPVFDLDGSPLTPDPNGFDTESIVCTRDGGFWLADEFGPSIVRVDGRGRVLARHVPAGLELPGALYPVRPSLPAILQHRQLNRGLEGLALSADERSLYAILQSPLAHPTPEVGREAGHVRLLEFDAATMRVAGQYLYPLDPPEAFRRDGGEKPVRRRDRKVSELVWAGPGTLLVLERVSRSTKIYRVELGPDREIPASHLEAATRPTIEEMSADLSLGLPALDKQLILDSDEHPELPADLEGLVLLGPGRLLLANDSDFGVEGAKTEFWLVTLSD